MMFKRMYNMRDVIQAIRRNQEFSQMGCVIPSTTCSFRFRVAIALRDLLMGGLKYNGLQNIISILTLNSNV